MVKIIKQIKNNRFWANTSWMMVDRLYQMTVSLIITMITARYLGATNYGIINYVAAFVMFAVPVCNLGFEGLIVKRMVEEPQNEGKIIGTSMFMQFVVSVFASIIIVVIVSMSNANDTVKTIVAILESIQLLFKSAEVIEYWYQSKLKSKYASIVKMIAYTFMSLYRVILLILKKDVVWFAFATSLDFIVIAILYLFLYYKHRGPKLVVDLKYGNGLLKDSYHFILANVMVTLYSQMDKIMIQFMYGDTEVGLYSASFTICSLWFFIPVALIASARPIIMELKKNRAEDLYLEKLKQLYSGVFWLGVVVSCVITVLAKPIILLLYGKGYLAATGVLVIGIWYGTFAQLGSARGIWILCENKNKYVKYYLVLGVITNFILNWLLIPTLGINGAAIATLVTQIVVSVVAPIFYKETRVHTRILGEAIFNLHIIKSIIRRGSGRK